MHGKQRIMEQAFNQALCSVFLKVFSVDVGHFCRSCFRLSSKIYRRARRESAKVQQLTLNENHEFLRWMLKSLTDSDTRERAWEQQRFPMFLQGLLKTTSGYFAKTNINIRALPRQLGTADLETFQREDSIHPKLGFSLFLPTLPTGIATHRENLRRTISCLLSPYPSSLGRLLAVVNSFIFHPLSARVEFNRFFLVTTRETFAPPAKSYFRSRTFSSLSPSRLSARHFFTSFASSRRRLSFRERESGESCTRCRARATKIREKREKQNG